MRIAVTGTPGTGKTTATDLVEEALGESDPVETELDVVHLNEAIRSEGLSTGRDEDRDTVVADLDAVRDFLADREDVLVESHLAHHVDANRVIVLRCDPATLEERLRERGESAASAAENAESEALDVILSEAVQRHGEESVYEIDTTDLTPAETADEIEAVVAGDREPRVGIVSFVEYLHDDE